MTDDQKRRAAMEKMFEEQKMKKEMINKALAAQQSGERVNHTTFENDDDDINVDDAFNMDIDEDEETRAPIEAKKWMFDSDDDESDEELGTHRP